MRAMWSGLIMGAMIMAAIIVTAFVVVQRRLGKHRSGTRLEFIGAFANSGVPAEIPAAVYDFYKSRILHKEFSIGPDDDFGQVLWEGEEDIDDDAALLVKKLGFEIPSQELRQQWIEEKLRQTFSNSRSSVTLSGDSGRLMQPVKTLRDMVDWLNWVRQHQH